MPPPGGCTSRRRRSASASRRSSSSSAGCCWCGRSRRGRPRRARRSCGSRARSRCSSTTRSPTLGRRRRRRGAADPVPLAVNADSLATWFLPRSRGCRGAASGRLRPAPRRPGLHRRPARVGHRHGRGHLARDAGRRMPRAPARRDAVRGRRDARRSSRWWLAATGRADAAALAPRPLVDFDRRDDLQTRVAARRGVDPTRAAAALRARVERLRDGGQARARLGAAARVPVDGRARAGELVRLGGPPVDVPLYWQQWNLRSPLLDAIADAVIAEARSELRA